MGLRVRSFRVWGIALSALLVAGSANAGLLVYSNGDQNFGPNNSFSHGDVFVGQDFTLNTDTILEQLVFNAHTLDGVTIPTTAVHVKIYSAIESGVGSELFGGSFPVASETVTGMTLPTKYKPSYTLKDFAVDLPSWSLPAGSYWLGLQVDPAQREMYWTITGGFAAIGMPSRIGDNLGDPASYGQSGRYDYENDFRLFAALPTLRGAVAPEPGAVAIWSLLGLIGTAGCWFQRRRSGI
jgi:hypothetical protein